MEFIIAELGQMEFPIDSKCWKIFYEDTIPRFYFNSFTANVANRRLGPPPLTLFKSLCLQTLT